MQPPRPSMDRTPSFEQARARSTPPFTSTYDRASSPQTHPQHSRTSSNASASSPYQQPFNPNANSYFPSQPHAPPGMYNLQPQSWSTTALPASAFYANPYYPHHQGGPVFHAGFQQSHADFQAWANAYQHMNVMMASMSTSNPGTPPAASPTEYQDERQRNNLGPQQASNQFDQGWTGHVAQPSQLANKQPQQQPQSFHPYKHAMVHRPSRENMPRSTSQPNLASVLDNKSPSSSISSTQTPQTSSDHNRSSSVDSSVSSIVPPRVASYTAERKDSVASEQVREVVVTRTGSPAPPKAASPAPTIKAVPQPLHTGPIANAINTPQTTNRPSPLSQATVAPSPEPEKPKTGLKGRFFKKDSKKQSTPPPSTPSPVKAIVTPSPVSKPAFASPSETSTRSATPPTTPPQDLQAPSRPFAMHTQALGSQISLAETERTATAPSEMTNQKSKRSLFRMKNMSTDNISLSSTVSSASMMIRKMGSIGRIARRNSLAGISKIFKEKPKDEDAGLPEKDGSKKKDKKKKGKAEPAAATVTHATAEPEDEDRALAGLSPAAKLARQHTLRSRAEQAKKDAERRSASSVASSVEYPSIGAVSNAPVEVVRVIPRQAPTVVHAVAVSEHEYDSEDDSSEGETVEDITEQMGKTSLSDEADREFQARWGSAFIDRNAVPKKGILKATKEYYPADSSPSLPSGYGSYGSKSQLSIDSTTALLHPTPNKEYDPFSNSFVPYESPAQSPAPPEFGGIYQNPLHNTSAPALALIDSKPPATRSMTVPARKKLIWAPECAVYQTYDPGTYDRRSEPATHNLLTPELALSIKQELNAFKMEMPVHPNSRCNTHYFP
ncbi:hypothetical protein BCR39DRAFT_460784 [Naematelia encephala]|uniref:Uncharacterized protein n=1 Tax=Naematelia encephala TaxID=71784 RepID=A0A1Y2BMH4_9TREE|nr:hypothetical protein BCR39DRAFT_460784 [Naematelia encephala]